MEDKDLRTESQAQVDAQEDMLDRARIISKEERRRLFWLVYCLDRHLALSFNSALHFPDGTFCVAVPLSETLWRSLETVELNTITLPSPSLGPLQTINGLGFFECFVPLATVLGHIIEFHHFHSNPLLGKCVPTTAVEEIERLLSQRQQDLAALQQALENPQSTGNTATDQTPGHLSFMYSSCMLHVLYILLHGKWDLISMMDNEDGWIPSEPFQICLSHAFFAVACIHQILNLDPELTFLPYMFSIYLLQTSFIMLIFMDRMSELGVDESVEEVCEVIIRAHEVSIMILDCAFQVQFYFPFLFTKTQKANPGRKTSERCSDPCYANPGMRRKVTISRVPTEHNGGRCCHSTAGPGIRGEWQVDWVSAC